MVGCGDEMDKIGYVYIITNKPNGILYVGVTSNMPRRMYEHREGIYEGFSKKYACNNLIYYEKYGDIRDAISREKKIKEWKRAWKVRLILEVNEEWADLSGEFYE
jgi:putative endonuclease